MEIETLITDRIVLQDGQWFAKIAEDARLVDKQVKLTALVGGVDAAGRLRNYQRFTYFLADARVLNPIPLPFDPTRAVVSGTVVTISSCVYEIQKSPPKVTCIINVGGVGYVKTSGIPEWRFLQGEFPVAPNIQYPLADWVLVKRRSADWPEMDDWRRLTMPRVQPLGLTPGLVVAATEVPFAVYMAWQSFALIRTRSNWAAAVLSNKTVDGGWFAPLYALVGYAAMTAETARAILYTSSVGVHASVAAAIFAVGSAAALVRSFKALQAQSDINDDLLHVLNYVGLRDDATTALAALLVQNKVPIRARDFVSLCEAYTVHLRANYIDAHGNVIPDRYAEYSRLMTDFYKFLSTYTIRQITRPVDPRRQQYLAISWSMNLFFLFTYGRREPYSVTPKAAPEVKQEILDRIEAYRKENYDLDWFSKVNDDRTTFTERIEIVMKNVRARCLLLKLQLVDPQDPMYPYGVIWDYNVAQNLVDLHRSLGSLKKQDDRQDLRDVFWAEIKRSAMLDLLLEQMHQGGNITVLEDRAAMNTYLGYIKDMTTKVEYGPKYAWNVDKLFGSSIVAKHINLAAGQQLLGEADYPKDVDRNLAATVLIARLENGKAFQAGMKVDDQFLLTHLPEFQLAPFQGALPAREYVTELAQAQYYTQVVAAVVTFRQLVRTDRRWLDIFARTGLVFLGSWALTTGTAEYIVTTQTYRDAEMALSWVTWDRVATIVTTVGATLWGLVKAKPAVAGRVAAAVAPVVSPIVNTAVNLFMPNALVMLGLNAVQGFGDDLQVYRVTVIVLEEAVDYVVEFECEEATAKALEAGLGLQGRWVNEEGLFVAHLLVERSGDVDTGMMVAHQCPMPMGKDEMLMPVSAVDVRRLLTAAAETLLFAKHFMMVDEISSLNIEFACVWVVRHLLLCSLTKTTSPPIETFDDPEEQAKRLMPNMRVLKHVVEWVS